MNTVKCPKCGSPIEISEALRQEIKLESQTEIENQLRQKIEEEKKTEILDLKKSLEEKNLKVDQMREQELKLREEKRQLEEKEKELQLEVTRRIDEAKRQIEEAVLKQALEEHRLKDMEKDKKISDMEKLIEELKQKAQQGSMQTQGEVLELDVEEMLKASFPHDEIEPVRKGMEGADIRQKVKSPKGYNCGVILWEVKRTKDWSNNWIPKLKSDLRNEKADVPVIVTTAFPKEMKGFLELREGVWVCGQELAITLAVLLRKNILEVAFQKVLSSSRKEKTDLLYEFITSHEFVQQVEAMVEIHREMKELIDRERGAFEKNWKIREQQIQRLHLATANIYGGVMGLVGNSMPQIKGLELLELEDGKG